MIHTSAVSSKNNAASAVSPRHHSIAGVAAQAISAASRYSSLAAAIASQITQNASKAIHEPKPSNRPI